MKQIIVDDYRKLYQFEEELAACIGYFDGLHLGHQKLVEKTLALAKHNNLKSALITFEPDPWTVLNPDKKVRHLTPMKEKIRLVADLGLDYLVIVKFNKEVMGLSPQTFVESILVNLKVRHLVCGEDFKFGYKGQGNVAYLKEHAHHFFDTHSVPIETMHGIKLGTTQIIQAILRGEMPFAAEMLGRSYKITGYVKQGNRAGTKIGFPTANLKVIDEYVIPKEGVYAGYATVLGKRYRSVVNIGYNPTFNHSERLSIESYILDFNEMIYGELVHQSFDYYLREEIKFDTIDDLVEQMHDDVKKARDLLD